MKISVVIIAHNEEKHIKACIDSLLNQTTKADEIILIAHNCTDSTVNIASEYPKVLTVPYTGTTGIVHARLEGISRTTGEIILCIDGDSVAKNNWIEEMTQTLTQNKNILVGSWVQFRGTLFGEVANIINRFNCKTRGKKAIHWIWGPSFGFWNKDKEMVKDILQESIALSKKLSLSRNPEDFWLAVFISQKETLR